MTWFEKLTGSQEESPERVREHLVVDGGRMRSIANGREWRCGTLETPTLSELRQRARTVAPGRAVTSVREVVANVQMLHVDASNAGAMFQVASQFNLLEMSSPDLVPEDGIGRYETDHTQGPACAVLLESELAPLDQSRYHTTDMPLLLRRGHVGFVHTSWLDCGPIRFHRVGEPENMAESDTRVLLSVLLWSQPIHPEYGFSELLVVLYWNWGSKQRLEVALQEELGSLDWEHLAVDRHAFLLNEHGVPEASTAPDDNL